MTHAQLLQQDLTNAVADAELLTRHQILTIFTYLNQALNYSRSDLKALVEDVLTETAAEPVATGTIVGINTSRRWVN